MVLHTEPRAEGDVLVGRYVKGLFATESTFRAPDKLDPVFNQRVIEVCQLAEGLLQGKLRAQQNPVRLFENSQFRQADPRAFQPHEI